MEVARARNEEPSRAVDPTIVPILLVDDKPSNILALEAVLASPEYRLVVAHSGGEAVRRLEEGDFALILLDVQMPGMDGFETASRMKEVARQGRVVPIIFVTGVDLNRSSLLRAYGEGAADLIQKPIDPVILRAKVSVFAELHRAKERAVEARLRSAREAARREAAETQLRHLATANAALAAAARMEEAQRARREFLARAGEALVSSLDYRTTLATVARLAVPELADWCSVDLVEPGTPSPSPVAIVHTESSMIVPLTHRGHVLGAMSFVYGDSGRRYTESDLAFAEDFARRAAMAIENAQAHAALGAALEFQERFVAVLGHDLRNPLGAIDMAAAVLRQRATMANDTATMHVLDRMRSSSTRMSRMIEQVLDLTRLRLAGGLALNPRPMDLRETLTRIVNELRMAHPSRSMVLRCESMCGTWDADRLEQVFSNLIANAVHYGAPDRPVTIDARLEDGAVRVEVHNEGEPIPEELRARLFDPFRRGTRESRHAKTAGLGLGLYICREIALAHRGCLDVQSSSPEGTTFRVTLPGGSPPPTAHCGDGSR